MKKLQRIFSLCWIAIFVVAGTSMVKAQEDIEYKVKAAYLLNFAKFVEWPLEKFATTNAPIIVGVLGKDPFGHNLEAVVAGKTVEGRKFEIRRMEEPAEATNCHILFMSASERRRVGQVAAALEKHSVLTVGESEQFTEQGGMIRFFRKGDKVRFEINAQAAEKAGLRISSKLLQLGKTADEKEKK